MGWKDFKVGLKLGVGFGAVLLLLAGIVLWAIDGNRRVVDAFVGMGELDALVVRMVEIERDHLVWANTVLSAMVDGSAGSLTVQKDYRKCGLGEWYYGEGRREAERRIPSIAAGLRALEAPHVALHESAQDIERAYAAGDRDSGSRIFASRTAAALAEVRSTLTGLQRELVRVKGGINADIGRTVRATLVALVGAGLVAVLLGLLFALLITRSITVPLGRCIGAARKLAAGDTGITFDAFSKDELGALQREMSSMTDTIRTLVSDAVMLAGDALAGKLDTRADAARHKGDFRAIVQGVNDTLDAVVGPLTVAADYVDRISKGDIPPKITESYNGDFNAIKDNLNLCIDAVSALVSDSVLLTQAAVEGKLQTRADASRHQGDFRRVVEGVNRTLDLVVEPINEIIPILKRMASGDLSSEMTGDYRGDFGVLKSALNDTLASINELLGEVSSAVEQVSAGSLQVSQASQSLSQGATEQASSLEEISSSITEIAGQTNLNTENAVKVNTLAKAARDNAELGNTQMDDLIAAMGAINASAEEIRKIVKVIDDISFQINLLALNANVEAARAGKYGKGFAVVAEEVRNLAVRSAGSVKETTGMVDQTIASITRGNEMVDLTGKQLRAIAGAAAQVAALAEEVAVAGKEQSLGLSQIAVGLNQIDQVTQANTAGAEESASAAEELSSQARQLKSMLGRFVLRGRSRNPEKEALLRLLQDRSGEAGRGAAAKKVTGLGLPTRFNLDDDGFGRF